ncbi:crossover junction endonuclease MUS81 [Galleria mellonella]|uniref:Crossover junction endonuclease MUS81 n=1 Tax=Galleria mellonella TaxID=7137 RepID=A0A6J1W7T4_GALME|nr:crossover junction endonuclease MUS81 [Galleria mellonella]
MNNITGKRITYKRTRPNPLFQHWLEELYEEAKEKKSKLEPMLKEALDSISKYPLPLQTGAECAILKGFEKKLCIFLDRRLAVYLSNNSENAESAPGRIQSNQSKHSSVFINKNQPLNSHIQNKIPICLQVNSIKKGNCSSTDLLSNKVSSNLLAPTNALKKCKQKVYKPAYRSGGYAILLALLENSQENPEKPSLTKEMLIDKAQKYSEESFIRPKPDTFYTAWTNIRRLVSKGYVLKSTNKKMEYMLTKEGISLAEELLKDSVDKPTVNDIIFNDMVTSSNTDIESRIIDLDTVDEPSLTNCQSSQGLLNNKSPDNNTDVNDTVYIEMLPGTFDIILLIDKNETGGVTKKNDPTVAQFNKYPDLKHEYRSLKVGDFTWIARSNINKEHELVLPYVIERKRMDDLGASIKDGRFHEQKFRLRKCGIKNVVYMVENYGKNKHVGLPIHSLMQALSNTRVQDDFKVHITDSLSNSARFLAMMTKRLTIEYKNKHLKGSSNEPSNENLMTYQYFNVTSSKTKPLTVKETFIKLLLQLKGISVEKAIAITNVYSTPALLMKTYQNYEEKEAEILLADLKYGDQGRKVGPVVSKSIYQLFSDKFTL